METHSDLVSELFSVMGRFRRQLRRSTGQSFADAGLTESQSELLRLIGRRPGISISEAASELGLVPNTASTLVSKLSSDGLLIRAVDSADRRVGRLRLTDPAQHIADASRAARRAALGEVLDDLDSDEIAGLTRGLAILTDLTRMLQERHHEHTG